MRYFNATSGLSTVLWAATMSAVIVRLAMSDRENRRLLEEVRTDPLTGLGNRGRMQVDLKTIFDRADLEHPAMLYLFDLNGFKRYNDTLGHPAGDELLARLGDSLRDAVGADGAAYRIGGDEFCLLLDCPRERFDAVAHRAAAALTASEKGVEVAASWGAAEIPREADSQSAAMQLADVRMYAQKESRRVAHPAVQIPEGTPVDEVAKS
jgi:diguanylate cyclase (GGDEF)-like protein